MSRFGSKKEPATDGKKSLQTNVAQTSAKIPGYEPKIKPKNLATSLLEACILAKSLLEAYIMHRVSIVTVALRCRNAS